MRGLDTSEQGRMIREQRDASEASVSDVASTYPALIEGSLRR
ncbi:hypothetical protein [Halorhabdus sp. CUG00001]|nr:hypothetical protein [Halorhabdus sp. CUG00001]